MRFSLGLRVLLLVTAVNAAVFGAGLTFLAERIASEREELSDRFGELLLYTLQGTINPEGELKVASILEWPWWGEFSDAIALPWSDLSIDHSITSILTEGPIEVLT